MKLEDMSINRIAGFAASDATARHVVGAVRVDTVAAAREARQH